LLDVMKESAVDCELNEAEHGTQTCFKFKTPSMEPAFHPLVEVDMKEKGSVTKIITKGTATGTATERGLPPIVEEVVTGGATGGAAGGATGGVAETKEEG